MVGSLEFLKNPSFKQKYNLLTIFQHNKSDIVVAIYIYAILAYSGTNFHQMLKNTESERTNCIISKDLSRIGRNYIQTSHSPTYISQKIGVHYVALNDGIDTEQKGTDIIAFYHFLNEIYPGRFLKRYVRSIHPDPKQVYGQLSTL